MKKNQPFDYTTHGMGEREMKKRIQSHDAMRKKSYEKHLEYKVPDAFLSDSFKMWMTNNPESPWLKSGGMDKLQKQATISLSAKARATKRGNTGYKLKKALEVKQAVKLKKDLNKLLGY